ncbi:MAG: AsnC family protein, partial [Gammaproteobacteria bacterium]|nr:AsnC family protein [Gammaproteobacteria bacterium]
MKVTKTSSVPLTVILTDSDKRLVAEIQGGLPLVARPYEVIAEKLGMTEVQVIERLQYFIEHDLIKRMGVIVRHHELGYRANAMVVWDIPDEKISELGQCMGKFEFVTLCYQRPRRLPEWPYNLFTMIHGHDREEVFKNLDHLIEQCQLKSFVH